MASSDHCILEMVKQADKNSIRAKHSSTLQKAAATVDYITALQQHSLCNNMTSLIQGMTATHTRVPSSVHKRWNIHTVAGHVIRLGISVSWWHSYALVILHC